MNIFPAVFLCVFLPHARMAIPPCTSPAVAAAVSFSATAAASSVFSAASTGRWPFSWRHFTVSYSDWLTGRNSSPRSRSFWFDILYGCFLGFFSSEHLMATQDQQQFRGVNTIGLTCEELEIPWSPWTQNQF